MTKFAFIDDPCFENIRRSEVFILIDQVCSAQAILSLCTDALGDASQVVFDAFCRLADFPEGNAASKKMNDVLASINSVRKQLEQPAQYYMSLGEMNKIND